jgi:hypothetical protein
MPKMSGNEHEALTGLVSTNESDSNGEPANVVDGLFAIARAIEALAAAVKHPGVVRVHALTREG